MQFSENVTLFGAGQVNKVIVAQALAYAPRVVAADGGAKIAFKMGQTPEFVVGDFDSVDQGTLARIPSSKRRYVAEQDSTDFEKCLQRISAPLILGVGFLGHRLDHQLAAMNALVKFSKQTCILLGTHDLVFHLPPTLNLELPPGLRLSLFPFAPVRGCSTGLQWPIDGIDFAPDAKIATSNRVTDGPVHLEMNNTGMLAILPRAALGQLMDALQPKDGVRAG